LQHSCSRDGRVLGPFEPRREPVEIAPIPIRLIDRVLRGDASLPDFQLVLKATSIQGG
jgi:hypothetical protein